MDREKEMREGEEGKRETKGVMELVKGRRKDRWKQERDEGWKDRKNYKQEKERDGQKDGWNGRDKRKDGWAERKIDRRREGKTDGRKDR